jgi:DNA mismatch repair ATPase MutS
VAEWLRAAGEYEALLALSAYAYEHPDRPFARVSTDGPIYAAGGLFHPLMHPGQAVPNDITLDDAHSVVIVSGSNMSGKSTLLRSVGINAVLAMAGAPVCAREFALQPRVVGASIRTQDSLEGGISRFYAEILRLRQIVGLAGERPTLFLIDEILHGTNSHDRCVGGEAVLRALAARQAAGLATTHDLALASLADDPALHAVNVHFEDQIEAGKMSFDYHLRPGVVTRSNALELMRAVGLEV